MAHNVVIEKDAAKYLDRLTDISKSRILNALEKLESNPHQGKHLSGNLRGFYSLRIGGLRAIYSIEGGEVVVHAIAPRGQAYR